MPDCNVELKECEFDGDTSMDGDYHFNNDYDWSPDWSDNLDQGDIEYMFMQNYGDYKEKDENGDYFCPCYLCSPFAFVNTQ